MMPQFSCFRCVSVFGTTEVCLFSIGCNRFEVTLEKSNKNFSKKIQQVSGCAHFYENCLASVRPCCVSLFSVL